MFKAVILDMDGLMIDSEPWHQQAFDLVFKKYGKHLSEEEYVERYLGISDLGAAEDMVTRFDLATTAKDLVREKQDAYLEFLKKDVKSRSGLLELLKHVKSKQMKIAIASSSALREVEAVIINLGIIEYVDTYCSAEEVEKGKPFPDVFLLAAKRLEVEPKDCLVLEDARSGMKAAKSVGMMCYIVPSRETKGQDFSLADRVFGSLAEVTEVL